MPSKSAELVLASKESMLDLSSSNNSSASSHKNQSVSGKASLALSNSKPLFRSSDLKLFMVFSINNDACGLTNSTESSVLLSSSTTRLS